MKIMIGCLITTLACSCHRAMDGAHSMRECSDLSKAMNEYSRGVDPYHGEAKFRFRGPLTITQVEQELAESYYAISSRLAQKTDGVIDRFENSAEGKAWREFKSIYREGDRFYFWMGIDREGLAVSGGYVLIRKSKALGIFAGWAGA